MRIIVTVPYTPWPVKRGTGRLIVNLLEGLSKRHEVTLVTMTLTGEELDALCELEGPRVSVRAMIAPQRRGTSGRILRKISNLLVESIGGIPQEVSYSAPREFLDLVAKVASDGPSDLILASYWHMYRLPEFVKRTKLALVTHDLNYVANRERLKYIPPGRARWRFERSMRNLGKVEIEAYQRFDTILTVTSPDAELLGGMPMFEGKKILPLPLALDLSVFSPAAFERQKNRILFLGSFHSDFNSDALSFFTSEVFPLVRGEIPEAVLEVVGHGADESLVEGVGEGVEFKGGVDDILPYLGGCSVMVLPLRFCGGVRIRMMEAAAMGTPVVSTPSGVAGMGLEPGADYLEASDAVAMAEAVVSLLRNGEEATRLGECARGWAERSISMEDYPDRLDAMLDTIYD